MDAAKIARRQMGGGSVAFLMNHDAPALVRNHARDNMLAIREKERMLRGKRVMESLKPPEQVFKLKQFDKAKPRVFENKLPRPEAHGTDNIKGHLRRLDADQVRGRPRSGSTPPPTSQREAGSEEAVLKRTSFADPDTEEGEEEMGLAEFEAAAERLKKLHGNKKPKTPFKKDAKGCPAYLQKIKTSMAEEKAHQDAARTAPKIPPGYKMMPDEEVNETLDALKKKREELEKEFQRLPLKIESDAQKRREKTLMEKIKETDDAIKIFSKPTVLVEA